MSNNKNPLNSATDIMVKHILVAYQHTEAACKSLNDLVPTFDKKPGVFFSPSGGCGKAVVLVNEFVSADYSIVSAETKWDFFSPASEKTSSYVGMINISDAVGGNFADRLSKFGATMGMAIGHWTFAWRPFFLATNSRGGSYTPVTVAPNPMIFHLTRFVQSFDVSVGKMYIMHIASSYNTVALSPQYQKLTQCTITDKSGGLHNSLPDTAGATGGIKPRAIEDSIKSPARTNRINKSKPMRTLSDVITSVELDTTQQKFAHKNQVQQWLRTLRNSFVDILDSPEQKGKLPLKYTFKLDPHYESFKVDNRNLPFEQPEQDQSQPGIRTLTMPQGSTIISLCDKVMHLSRKVGEEHAKKPAESYRITSTHVRECGGDVRIHTKINHHIPAQVNANGVDTSPGDHILGGPIELEYQKASTNSGNDDTDIISLTYSSTPDYGMESMEKNSKAADALAIYGEREQPTSERLPGDFFKAGFRGLRAITKSLATIVGLEAADDAAKIDNFTPSQKTKHIIEIRGNPNLLNDINRNPLDVADDSASWPYLLYDKPEVHPMYLKLTIFMEPATYLGSRQFNNVAPAYYYDGFLHIASITNKFSGSSFTQTLECMRSEPGM